MTYCDQNIVLQTPEEDRCPPIPGENPLIDLLRRFSPVLLHNALDRIPSLLPGLQTGFCTCCAEGCPGLHSVAAEMLLSSKRLSDAVCVADLVML